MSGLGSWICFLQSRRLNPGTFLHAHASVSQYRWGAYMSFLRQCWSADHKRISSRWPGQAIAFVVVVILLFANTCIVWPPDTAENDSALLILLGSGLSARTESQLDFRDPERLFYSAALPEGYAMDIAFHQHQLIVALQGKNRQKDQLIFLRTNGSILKSTDLPAASLAAIDSWQDNLYILNRVQSRDRKSVV